MGKMITGSEILKRVKEGTIQITDFDMKRLNPNSYNLRIGDKIGYYPMNEYCEYAYSDFERKHPIYYLDTMRKNTTGWLSSSTVYTPAPKVTANTDTDTMVTATDMAMATVPTVTGMTRTKNKKHRHA